MRVLKPLSGDGYTQNSYLTLIPQYYSIISGSTLNTEFVTIDIADEPPVDWTSQQDKDIDLGSYNSVSGIYSYPLFGLINRAFYSTQSIVEYVTSSFTDVTKFTPSASIYVFNVVNNVIGEGIKEGTFSIRVSGSSIPILDDGYGRLYVNNTSNVVGNIFYKHGFAVVKNNISAPTHSISTNGLKILPFRFVDVNFSSSHNTIEHTIICKLTPTEFNSSLFNPSTGYYRIITGSYISESTTVTYKNFIPQVSSSAKAMSGEHISDLFDSGTLTPYVTSIGLYDTKYNLVAIARLATPVPRAKNVDQTFIIKFDT